MITSVDSKAYRHYFQNDPHPFISNDFIEMNNNKVDSVVRLIDDGNRKMIGLVAGVKSTTLFSPFSAPFGGFHFRSEIIVISEIDRFIDSLKEYMINQGFTGFEITLPPIIYHPTFTAKVINSLSRKGFTQLLPDITGWIDLDKFKYSFAQKNTREAYKKSMKNGLSFVRVTDLKEREVLYEVISKNRAKFNRPIHMSFQNIIDTSELWDVDFFKISTQDDNTVAAAIFYRSHKEIIHAAFWGDSDDGRELKAIDFLAHNMWSYYKDLGYRFIDVGISTEGGVPNEGLLRFKESHDSISSIRYKFIWKF